MMENIQFGSMETAVLVVAATTALFCVKVLFLSSDPVALDPKKVIDFTLIEREDTSHDTRRYRFALQSPDHVLGLPIGKHILLSANCGKDGKKCLRAYTPVSSDADMGYFDLVVKTYFPNVHPKFPDGGRMGMYMEEMKVGDSIGVRGPAGKITYSGRGQVLVEKGKMRESGFKRENNEKLYAKQIGMVCGGTGITPMLQIVRAAMKDPQDKTVFHLLFANKTEDDILLRSELEAFAKDHPESFKLWFTIDEAKDEWKYDTGFITQEMMEKHLPAPSDDTLLMICGPPPMVKFACLPGMAVIGHDFHNILEF
ncbi:hypothetical protein SARC_03231 [Sphaeroforma arctica JP610]|uniref:NADH-cytochrome b5 reductase n=1 Tax=Sphaeroforma arctica JP610 TaxID=667725 RepID=A0A0L0G8J3_9EUKA|nr:hypothetical protein SARC_03231 [Sphaeroforma arctica JP610]KNC84558.1 hypothetical protein SARC_03231 [Sphaeroforma arctica JP610]|eukprot:XP_014158460.1 hypothetical protein SARC_03231 [Sphaeroforma arctica JP610]